MDLSYSAASGAGLHNILPWGPVLLSGIILIQNQAVNGEYHQGTLNTGNDISITELRINDVEPSCLTMEGCSCDLNSCHEFCFEPCIILIQDEAIIEAVETLKATPGYNISMQGMAVFALGFIKDSHQVAELKIRFISKSDIQSTNKVHRI